MKRLLLAVSQEFWIDPRSILGGDFTKSAVEARQVAYWVLRQTTRLSYEQIAKRFNRRYHDTALDGFNEVERRRKVDNAFRLQTNAVLSRFLGEDHPRETEAPAPQRIDAKPLPAGIGIGGMLYQ
jgi:chromosomal replication initiation ATPase DnaA